MAHPILEVEHFSLSFTQYRGLFGRVHIPAIRDLSLRVHPGEMVAVVGASGSGKSLLAHGILGILPYNAAVEGVLRYDGAPLTPQRQKAIRGKELVLVPQSVSYLDPLMKVGPQVRNGRRDEAARSRSQEVLGRYGLDPHTEDLYPFQLSGGMARRVLIATAVMEQPRLVIADEPTPGLHPQAAQRVLGHFRELADQGAGVLLITHDLELALMVAQRIVVFYAGTTLEEVPAAAFERESTLRHPYTRALWRAMPQHGFCAGDGSQPYAEDLKGGCPYRTNCPQAHEDCSWDIPYRQTADGFVRCIREVAL
jgi:peptide/nickel transport system ATP-binding protein